MSFIDFDDIRTKAKRTPTVWGVNIFQINEDYFRVEFLTYGVKKIQGGKSVKSISHYQRYMDNKNLKKWLKFHNVLNPVRCV